MGEKIVLTYETLFEILRIEKSRNELQELEATFFSQVVEYIKEKQQMGKKDSIFAEDEAERTARQLVNVKKILKELYERREKKILEIALNKSRTSSDIVQTAGMLSEERILFEKAVGLLNNHRQDVLYQILEARLPKKEERNVENTESRSTAILRFLHAVPRFLGTDLTTFGPFEEDDVASLPRDMAEVLITRKRAVEMNV